MKTLYYTGAQVRKAIAPHIHKLPAEFHPHKLPRTEDGLIVGGMVDDESTVHDSAVVIGSTITASSIKEDSLVVGSVIKDSFIGKEAFVESSEIDHSTAFQQVNVRDSWVHRSTIDHFILVVDSVVKDTLAIGKSSRIYRSFLNDCYLYQARISDSLAVDTKLGELYRDESRVFDFGHCVMFNHVVTGKDDETRHVIGAHGALVTPKTPVRAAEIGEHSFLHFFNKLDGSAVIDTGYTNGDLPLHATAEAIESLGTLNWGREFVKEQFDKINEATSGLAAENPGKLIGIKGVDAAINLLNELEASFK